MAEDIVVKLRAEADTAQIKEFYKGLEQSFAAARKAGLSLADAEKVVRDQIRKAGDDAKYAGMEIGKFLNSMLPLQARSQGMLGLVEAIKKVKKEAQDASKAHHEHASAIGHVTKELAGMAAGYFAVHKVVHTLIESYQEFAKFDNELRKIQNNISGTDAEMQKLAGTFKALSKGSGSSVEDIIAGFEEIREGAHLSAQQAEALMGTIVQGAKAAQVPVKEMGDVLASMMRNMKVEGADAGKVMDYMAAASAHLRLDMGQMANIMPRLTEVFGEMGYTGEQGAAAMLAWTSALRGVTKNSAEAGNAAARMLEQISGPGMAAALRMPQSELHRIIEQAKDEGTDVMSVITGMLVQQSEQTGRSINQILDKMTVRERRYWRAAVENREKVRHADEELVKHSEGTAKRFADNFKKGPQQTIDEMSAAWTAFKLQLGESMGKLGVTAGLEEATDNLDILTRNFEIATNYALVLKEYMKDISQGKILSNSPETEAATKQLRETIRRNADERKARIGKETPMSDQERLEAAFGKTTPREPKTGRPVPGWVPNAYKGTFYGGYTGPNLSGGAQPQHFAGGGGFDGGGNTIAGRNWQHDLLGSAPMSGNIDDRRNTEATQKNTDAIDRLIDLMEDVDETRGGLADQLGAGSIGGGGGGRGRGGGVAQRFSGGGGGGMEGGGGRMGTGGGGGHGGGSGQASGSGGGFEGGEGLPNAIAPISPGGSKAAGKGLGGAAEDPQAQFLQQHRAKLMEELNSDPKKMQAFKELVAAETGGQGAGDQQAFVETTLDRWAARGQNVQQGIASNYYGNNPRSRTPSAQLNRDFSGIVDRAGRGSAMYPGATGNASDEPGNPVLSNHRRRGELAGVGPGGEGYVYENNEQDNAFRRQLKQAGGQTTGNAGGGENTTSASGNVQMSNRGGGTTRNRPLDPRLEGAFQEAAAAAGVKVDVTSGGQTSSRDPSLYKRPGGWTGSMRHNEGRAADFDLRDDSGKIIPRNDPRYIKFIEEAAARGAGGAGFGYMGGAKAHMGITGDKGVPGEGLGVYKQGQATPAELAAANRGIKRFREGGSKYTTPNKEGSPNVDTSKSDQGRAEGYSRFLGGGRGTKKDEDLDTASGKSGAKGGGRNLSGGGKDSEREGKATPLPEVNVKPQTRNINYNLERVQFARRDREMDRQADTALRLGAERAASGDHGVA